MESDYLPSGKFVKIVVALVVLVVFTALLYKGFPALKHTLLSFWNRKTEQIAEKNKDAYADYRNLDTDSDGLLDWEEALYGTDPDLTDTNGDGVSDYIEFGKAGNIPAGILPADDQSISESFNGAVSLDSNDPDNLTDALARDLYTSLSIAKQQAGGTLPVSDTEQLATIAARGIQTFSSRVFTSADITLGTDTAADRARFKTAIDTAWSEIDLSARDIRSMMEAIENDGAISVSILAKLPTYQALTQKLAQISTPAGVIKQYVAYLNATEQYLSALVAIGYNDTDPARAIAAITNLESILDTFIQASQQLQASIIAR